MHILKNTCQWLLHYQDAKILEKYFFLGIWMFLPNLFEPEYIWIFSVFEMVIFFEKKEFCITYSIFRSSRSQTFFEIGRCSWKFRKFPRKTVTSESLINKVAGLQAFRPALLLKRDSYTGVFLWNLRNFYNTFSYSRTAGGCFWVLIDLIFNETFRFSLKIKSSNYIGVESDADGRQYTGTWQNYLLPKC